MAKFKLNGMGFGEGTGGDKPGAPKRKKDSEVGYSQHEFNLFKQQQIKKGLSGGDLRAVLNAWKQRKKKSTTYVKTKKEDLI